MKVLDIMRGTTVDGPGFRTSIYLSGCRHHCPGCHNPQSWDPDGGTEYSLEEILAIVKEEDFDVTLSGGDPLFDPESTALLAGEITRLGYGVWIYTGYTWEQIMADDRLLNAVKDAEVVVDSPFIEALKDPDLLFRGSSNQQLVDVKRSLSEGKAVSYPG